MVKTYLAKMKGLPATRKAPCWRDALWSWLGAFLGMTGVGWLSAQSMQAHSLLMVGSFCSGSLKPDTHLGGIVATKVEVIHGQTTSFLFY